MVELKSMPEKAPLYPNPPIKYEDAELLASMFTLKKEIAEKLIPEPLKAGPANLGLIVIAYYPKTSIGPYHESFLWIQATHENQMGFYCPYIYVTTDASLAAGREIWGFPKKIAEISINKENNKITGLVKRKDVELIKIEANIIGEGTLLEIPKRVYTLKQMIRGDGTDYDIKYIVATDLEWTVKEAKTCTGTLEFKSSPEDPLEELKPISVIGTFFIKMDFTLPYGKII